MLNADTSHYSETLERLKQGTLVPFLGAGANLCGRPKALRWRPTLRQYLPQAQELARYLAKEFHYTSSRSEDLSRVSQYVDVIKGGTGPLYAKLRSLLDRDRPSTDLHHLLARIAGRYISGQLGDKAGNRDRFVVVSTNYDDLLERAYHEKGLPFHLVTYEAEGEHRGYFYHWRSSEYYQQPSGEPMLIEMPSLYSGLSEDSHPIILKIHGSVDRRESDRRLDSFVITEDHYMDYLTHTDISTFLPRPLSAILMERHILFLGYSLRDWNLRVMLHRIWKSRRLTWDSWAIQLDPDALDREFWRRKGIKILNEDLNTYIRTLGQNL